MCAPKIIIFNLSVETHGYNLILNMTIFLFHFYIVLRGTYRLLYFTWSYF